MASVHEQLSKQFYQWELRGRGWKVFDEPVYPEPVFQEYFGNFLPESPDLDDGRKPTFLSSLFRKVSQNPQALAITEIEEEPEPQVLIRDQLVELQTALPATLNIPKESFEQFLSNLSLCREPLAFELLGTHQSVIAQFAAHEDDSATVRRQLQAYFPEAVFQKRSGVLEEKWDSCEGDHILTVEFGLEREFMFPLASGKLDPFIGIIGALSELQPGEFGLFQVLFQPVQNNWAESITRSVTHADGKPFFINMPELAGAAEKKVVRPLYGAVVRLMVRTTEYQRTSQIARDLAGSLRVFINPQGNALVPLANDDYPFEEHITDTLARQSRRSGMLLNVDELIGFVHLPSSAVRSPVLLREVRKTKAAPAIVRNSTGVLLGNNPHADENISVRLSREHRTKHCHIVGTSGTGKSTLLFNLICQDIKNGEGIAVIDPHGDLIDRILGIIPPERIDDVILVDPSDEEYSIGFNILSAHSDLEKNLLASDLVSVFERLSTSWGDQMGSVLQNSILAFLESSKGGTLPDLRRFLIEKPFRNQFLETVNDPEIVYYWKKVFPTLSGNKSIGSVLTRLQGLLDKKSIRNMISQPENRLDFADITDNGKIFLARLPEGLLGQENSNLLGTLLVSKFQQLAMSRQAQQISARRDFWIYADEFHNYITPSMAQILSGARKYRIGLTLAHHELHQLQRNSDVASAVMSHPFTRIVFKVGDDDAKKLGDGFSFFEARDLKNLEPGQAICRIDRSDFDFNLTVPLPDKVDEAETAKRRKEVITASREKYGRSRAEVEAMLAKLAEPLNITVPTFPPFAKSEQSVRKIAEAPKITEVRKSGQPISEPKPAPVFVGNEDESQHLAIKNKIGAEAETLDYTVTYEEHFPTIKGRADVVLRRGALAVVVQVSVTTPVEFEVESVQKFLQADFKHIAVICANRKKLSRIQQALSEAISVEHSAKVGCYTQDEFISKLYDWATSDPQGAVIERGKPRKQKINLSAGNLTNEERQHLEGQLLKKLSETMKRKPTI